MTVSYALKLKISLTKNRQSDRGDHAGARLHERVDALVRDGLATATHETVHAGERPSSLSGCGITDAGQRALAG
jgi:hypothetical protein